MTMLTHVPLTGAQAKPCRDRPSRRVTVAAAAALLLAAAGAPQTRAQSSVNPSTDWNANYGFSSPAEKSLRLIQSDFIRKAEEGFYDRLSDTFNVTNNITNVDNSTTQVGQQTTTIGSVNTATNEIDISGDGVRLDLNNSSTNTGCLNGAITIDSPDTLAGTSGCR